jgi:hypothetical protein
MRTVKTLLFAGIFCFTCLAANPPADPTPDTSEANLVIQAALQPSPLEANLHRLTDEIGGRVPGTVAMQHAVTWGVQAFTAAAEPCSRLSWCAQFPRPGRPRSPR